MEHWHAKTRQVLEMVFEERCRQVAQYGFNRDLEDGTGPSVRWLRGVNGTIPAEMVEKSFREDYEEYRARRSPNGLPTWMHLVREEIAEAFELSGNDPNFVAEILQVAALCVSWAEGKIE